MKRKRAKKSDYLQAFEVVKAANGFLIYACSKCSKAWRYPDPLEGWRVQGLLAHTEAHKEAALARSIDAAAEEAKWRKTGPKQPKKKKQGRTSSPAPNTPAGSTPG